MRGPKKERNFLGSRLSGWPVTDANDGEIGGVPEGRRTQSGSVRRGDGPALGTAAQSPLNALLTFLRT
ncbi:hypothetical protein SAMN04488063_3577 [Halopelagius inordinatus]|uniref:Uncharacterized protein n=1 Tax=Halopelagius inordinatus TaxID=553467 RepID=A0A1I2WIB3_9EURY|nr:hypothetical protein [Halopelagius inordinatus]SFH01048.1 hypothetical protein SAMN04488063_3577 [Halopelagius inordinatus]